MNERSRKTIAMALKIRAFEGHLLELYGEGRIRGTVHTCLGQELTPCVLAANLGASDLVFGTHRAHGYFLALTGDYEGLAREILGKGGGVSQGIGGSQHLHEKNFMSNGVQGGLVPVAVGSASANRKGISVAVIGDGTLGQGVVYESLNVAKLQASATLIVLEDNGIAQSTPSHQVLAGNVRQRFEAFDWNYVGADDSNLDELESQVADAVRLVRDGAGPTVLHVKTRRLGPHSKGDDTRSEACLQELAEGDYLSRLIAKSSSYRSALEGYVAEVHSLIELLLQEPPAATAAVRNRAIKKLAGVGPIHSASGTNSRTIRMQTTRALEVCLQGDQDTWLIGEDVEHLPPSMGRPYSGAFGVSANLSELFPGQVRNFPISEQAMVGFAIGRSLSGSATVAEIMFGDFATLVVDQVRQQASKIIGMYGESVRLPLVIRTPMGGRRGYGPTHSQSLEGLFFGIPHVAVTAISPFGVREDLFATLLDIGVPVVVLENKDLYSLAPREEAPQMYDLLAPERNSGPWRVKPTFHEADVTVVSYGHAGELVLRTLDRLARRHEIFAEVFILELLSPLTPDGIPDSLKATGRLLLVEEGLPEMGIASSVMAALGGLGLSHPFSVRCVGSQGDVGASLAAEGQALISEERIAAAAMELMRR